MPERLDGRKTDTLRPVTITPGYLDSAEGSALIQCGGTRIICAASIEETVPRFLKGKQRGWVTAEYGMLPRSTGTRMIREVSKGRPSGRTQEIQRLIGRALRSVVDLDRLGERTAWVDCDVIQADGGTRTASITGAFVALAIALEGLRRKEVIGESVLIDHVAAVSVGIVQEEALLDLAYDEDCSAEVDMNVVMTGRNEFVEIQGTAEGKPFSKEQLEVLLSLASAGIQQLIQHQREALTHHLGDISAILRKDP